MQKYHYVYKITNTHPTDDRKYYIGVRSSTVKPEEDTNYRSSSNTLKVALKEIGHENFKKEILSIWETRKLAIEEEIRLHKFYDVAVNPEYYNQSRQLHSGFDTTGYVNVFDIEDRKTKQVTKEEYDKCENYMFVTKGMMAVIDERDGKTKQVTTYDYSKYSYYKSLTSGLVVVKDIETNKTVMVTIDDYKNNSKYKSVLAGKVNAIDTRTGKSKQITKDEFDQYDYYKHSTAGTVMVIDTRDGIAKRVSHEDFCKFEYYVSTSSKKIEVYKADNTLFGMCYGRFDKFCYKYNLSYYKLIESYKNNGEPIFQNASNNTLTQLKRVSREFQIGWYAIKVG